MKSSRLFQIVYELMSGERVTAPELARRLEVSVRTIYRDVEALCQAGVPIATGQGQGGGIRLMDGFVLDRTLMSPDEQERLLLAVKALASATGKSWARCSMLPPRTGSRSIWIAGAKAESRICALM